MPNALVVLTLAALADPPTQREIAWRHVAQGYGVVAAVRLTSDSLADADPRQWTSTVRVPGLAGVVLHARLADGYCFWPAASATASVKGSPWRRGTGDLVGELASACAADGLAFGVSLANGSGADHAAQLEELCSRYGPLAEVRFDDATEGSPAPPPSEPPPAADVALIARLQPTAEIAAGSGVSIRPGWFWRQSENEHVKSLERLERLWYETVGEGELLRLGVPIDGHGRIPAPDVERLREFGELLQATFASECLRGRPARASDQAAGEGSTAVASINDGSLDTVWSPDATTREATVEFDLAGPTPVNRIEIFESAALGARIDRFTVEAAVDQGWRPLAEGTAIGPRRVLRCPTIVTERLRLRVHASQAAPAIAEMRAFTAPPEVRIDAPTAAFTEPTSVALVTDMPDAAIHYTLDGTTPTRSSPRYEQPLLIERSKRLRAAAWRGEARSLAIASRDLIRFDPSDFQPAVQFIRAPDPGVRLRISKGGFRTVAEMRAAPIVEERVVETIGLPRERSPDQLGLIFEGFIEAPADGVYTFSLRSDDGSVLYLHNRLLVDRDGGASWEWNQGRIPLQAGWHPIRVEYFEISGEERLQLRWEGPGFDEENIPKERLAH